MYVIFSYLENLAFTIYRVVLFTWVKSIHSRCAKCTKCEIFGTFDTPNTKKHFPSDVLYVPYFYHLCPYRCKFATVRTQMPNRKIIFYSTFLSPPTSLLDFFSLLLEFVSLSQVPNHVLPLLTIGRKQEESGGDSGQERRKGSRDFVEIGGGIEFAERSGLDFWFLISLFSLICWVVGS